ncbi:MAG: LCP family protein [Clostridiales bacterium]|nr:LCP family protein [Clostridiales bacterium]
MAKKRKKKESKALKMLGWVILSIEVIAMMVLTFTLLRFPVLPGKYWVVYGAVSVLLLGISTLILMKQTGFARFVLGMLFALVISCLYLLGFMYLEKTRGTLNNISGQDSTQYIVSQMAVIVREEDDATRVDDILGDLFGVQKSVDYDNSRAMVEFINNHFKANISTSIYDDYSQLATALLQKQVRAIIVEKSYVETMEEYEQGFAEGTRVLGEFEFTSAVPNVQLNNSNNDSASMPERGDKIDVTKDYFTVYLSGIDTYGSINVKSRSDVNIVMVVNPKTHKILLVNIPRDAFVIIPGVSGDKYDKLTHAGTHGVKTSMATLENIYGIKLDYYLRVNFSSVEKFVDVLGGVDVESPIAFTSLHTKHHFKQGINHMDGKMALEFVRERYAFAAGDVQRGKNQMAMIRAVIDKMKSPVMLMKFNDIMNAVNGNFQTDLTMDQLTSLVRMQLDEAPDWKIDTYTVETAGAFEYCYSYRGSKLYVGKINQASLKEASDRMKAVMEGKN